MELRPAGDRGILVVLERSIPAAELHRASEAARTISNVIACVPGHSSLLTIWSGEPDRDALRNAIAKSDGSCDLAQPRRHRIDVSFAHVPDLDEFLRHTKLGLQEFLVHVSRLRLTARYLGFRAGFAYLDGWPEEWSMPRRPTSRAKVEAGSFAVAGSIAGFYPIDSPGGWNLLGRTNAPLWDERRDPPNLIAPGDEIEIVPTRDPLNGVRPAATRERLELAYAGAVAAPLARLVRGTADWTLLASGRPAGGPFDPRAAARANAATGNSPEAPLLECAIAGPRLRLREDGLLSWHGATAEVRVNGEIVPDGRQFAVKAGDEVIVGRTGKGLRGYLAFGREEGRIEEDAGDDRWTIRVVAGPHEQITGDVECEVTPQLDRVGIRMRLVYGALPKIPADLVSCGMQFGTVQLHPDGTLVAMGPDHPVTGGYLQPMTVVSSDLWKLGQLMPGERVRFVKA